jgi:hypothetical protein
MSFHRIGAPHWFAYAMDPDDPSRRLADNQDFDPVDGAIPVEDAEETMAAHVGSDAELFKIVLGRA